MSGAAATVMEAAAGPERILEVGFGFWPSKVLLTAVELGVFSTLGDESMSGQELGSSLRLHPRGIGDFFDALVALGFLARDGNCPAARYRNTPATARFHPHLECVSFDLPPVEPIARRWIEREGAERVRAESGDFLKQPLPKADVITMGMILHDWNLEKKTHLVRLERASSVTKCCISRARAARRSRTSSAIGGGIPR